MAAYCVSRSTQCRTMGANTRAAGNAIGHAVAKACAPRMANPGVRPVSLNVTMAAISSAIVTDIRNANSSGPYFFAVAMLLQHGF